MQYELYYDGGGHGGPYQNLVEAWAWAQSLLKGSSTLGAVEIRPRNSPALGGYSRKNKDSFFCFKFKPNVLYNGYYI